MLYDRDYNKGLTQQEEEEYKKINGQKFQLFPRSRHGERFGRVNRNEENPIAVRLYSTLFPNFYLDNIQLKDSELLRQKNSDYILFLNEKCRNERDVLNFIKHNKAYHIIGAILEGMSLRTGNHGAFLFPEFQLSNKYQVDYLLVGKSSGGFEFVFIELENPYGKITIKNGDLGNEFRDGISQVKDWRRWLPQNYASFSETIKKYKHPYMDLPDEFYNFDASRFHFAVVAGRRSDFNEMTYMIARETRQQEDIALFHYDNLYDFANEIIGHTTY